MIPISLLKSIPNNGVARPRYLDDRDHPWIQALLDQYQTFTGKSQRQLFNRLSEELSVWSPAGKKKLAAHFLKRMTRDKQESSLSPKKVREILFGAAAQAEGDRGMIVRSVACRLGVTEEEIEKSLFADLMSERIVTASKEVSIQDLILESNLLLAQGFLFRAASVEIEFRGNARAIIRHAKLRGLICTVKWDGKSPDCTLILSGPFSLFRRTLLYGKSLSELVPMLAWCDWFRLRADCIMGRDGNERILLEVKSGDPLAPGNAPKRYDSRVEERFAKDFARLGADWDLIREPQPFQADGTLIFPDFSIVHRRDDRKRYFLEIVGFWTDDYLVKKLERLREAKISNLILCINENLNCSSAGSHPSYAKVIFFKRKIDPREVLDLLQ